MIKISGTIRGQLSVLKPESMIFIQTDKNLSKQQPNQPKVLYIKRGTYRLIDQDVKYAQITIFSNT